MHSKVIILFLHFYFLQSVLAVECHRKHMIIFFFQNWHISLRMICSNCIYLVAKERLPFYGWVISHSIYKAHFLYLVIRWWTFGLILRCELSCKKCGVLITLQYADSRCVRAIPRVGMFSLKNNSPCNVFSEDSIHIWIFFYIFISSSSIAHSSLHYLALFIWYFLSHFSNTLDN